MSWINFEQLVRWGRVFRPDTPKSASVGLLTGSTGQILKGVVISSGLGGRIPKSPQESPRVWLSRRDGDKIYPGEPVERNS